MTPTLTKIQRVCCSECLAFPSTFDWQLVQTRRKWVSKRHTTQIRINDRATLGLFPTRVLHDKGSPTSQHVRGDSSMDPSMDPSSSRAFFFFFFTYYKAPQINEEQPTGVKCRPPHLDALSVIPKYQSCLFPYLCPVFTVFYSLTSGHWAMETSSN